MADTGVVSGIEEPAVSLNLLYEESGLPGVGIPPALAAAYGGDLALSEPCVYANFVASIDGVAALGPEHPSSGSVISGGASADRFVMGLLRAFADAVIIGAGTLRASPGHRWTPDFIYPAAADGFAALRHDRHRAARPELVVVTARGNLPVEHPGLQAGAVVVTTTAGAERLDEHLPETCTVLAVDDGPDLAITDVVTTVTARGHTAVLTEGGPHLLGQLVGGGLLNELFLTTSPVLGGRADTSRPGLISGLELLPDRPEWAELVSARQYDSYLLLRYRLRRTHRPGGSHVTEQLRRP